VVDNWWVLSHAEKSGLKDDQCGPCQGCNPDGCKSHFLLKLIQEEMALPDWRCYLAWFCSKGSRGILPKYFKSLFKNADWLVSQVKIASCEKCITLQQETWWQNQETYNRCTVNAGPACQWYKVIDIDTDWEWTNVVAQHVMKCGSLFKFVTSKKKFKLIDFFFNACTAMWLFVKIHVGFAWPLSIALNGPIFQTYRMRNEKTV
jgi:hypothetical protein